MLIRPPCVREWKCAEQDESRWQVDGLGIAPVAHEMGIAAGANIAGPGGRTWFQNSVNLGEGFALVRN